MLQVGINGYGTIGKRVAEAAELQDDMTVIGVTKTSPGHETADAESKFNLYGTTAEAVDTLREAGHDVTGDVGDLVEQADIIVDATPAGTGKDNKPIYQSHDTPAVFQGGEPADVADASFNSAANYSQARDADYVRVVSCNTTGLSRLISTLEVFGVSSVHATLIRRGGDPDQHGRGPINDIVLDPPSIPSHHSPDLRTIYPGIDICTHAVKVPMTLMHLQGVKVQLNGTPTEEEVIETIHESDRLACIPARSGIRGCAGIKEAAGDRGRARNDVWENCVWESSVAVDGNELHLYQAIHQEANVVPENIDAIRAVAAEKSQAESRQRTNDALGVGLEF